MRLLKDVKTAALFLHLNSEPNRTRTCNPMLRRHVLYPLSYESKDAQVRRWAMMSKTRVMAIARTAADKQEQEPSWRRQPLRPRREEVRPKRQRLND